jgi:hypothetical protein
METKLSLGPLFSGEQRLCRPDTAAWFAKHLDITHPPDFLARKHKLSPV